MLSLLVNGVGLRDDCVIQRTLSRDDRTKGRTRTVLYADQVKLNSNAHMNFESTIIE